ncbi:MAG TPA: BON domain-containing protein [Flavitalea sp.]|nr:BON domain-containing protein [Flavitalea sp.]
MRILIVSIVLFLASCSQGRTDNEIEKELDHTLRAAAPGVVMTVKAGVVTLSGTCPDESCKHTTETSAKNTKGVNAVVNNIIISTPPAPAATADVPAKH